MGDSEPRSEFSSGPSAAPSSAALPDEGAELRDQIVQIREAPNLRILSALLVRLLALLERRFAWEEGEAGDLRALDREAADRMSGQHRDIILTSSNAAKALELVVPEIREIGFMADSVRVPVDTESLIILNMTFQSKIGADGRASVTQEILNEIYKEAASGAQKGQLVYSEEQNVPADVVGMRAAVVIEGVETHTRTGFAELDLAQIPGIDPKLLERRDGSTVRVPVTHAKVFGWYDNEYGSYTNMYGDLTVHVHRTMD